MIIDIPRDPGEITLESDKGLLNKALSHILNNSIKFTKEGAITLGFKQQADKIIIFVKDTGIGMDRDDGDRIFNLFMQADTSISRDYEGSGLGLSIARGYMDLLGGTIRFESEKYKGATFYMSIPLKREGKN